MLWTKPLVTLMYMLLGNSCTTSWGFELIRWSTSIDSYVMIRDPRKSLLIWPPGSNGVEGLMGVPWGRWRRWRFGNCPPQCLCGEKNSRWGKQNCKNLSEEMEAAIFSTNPFGKAGLGISEHGDWFYFASAAFIGLPVQSLYIKRRAPEKVLD